MLTNVCGVAKYGIVATAIRYAVVNVRHLIGTNQERLKDNG